MRLFSRRRSVQAVVASGAACAFAGLPSSATEPSGGGADRGWLVPVGGVIMWWGEKRKIPAGFEHCDGRLVRTVDSPLLGRSKPDLVGRFPKGAVKDRESLDDLTSGRGGANDLPAHFHGLGTLATAPSTGEHQHGGGTHGHSVSASDDDHGDGNSVGNAERDQPRDNITTQPNEGAHTHTGGVHGHTFTGVVGKPGTVSGDVPIKDANQPAYSELFFIIRVK